MKLTSHNDKLIYINPNIVIVISVGEGAYRGYTYIKTIESEGYCVKEPLREVVKIWGDAINAETC
jgi:hypothetical protein